MVLVLAVLLQLENRNSAIPLPAGLEASTAASIDFSQLFRRTGQGTDPSGGGFPENQTCESHGPIILLPPCVTGFRRDSLYGG